MISMPNSSYNSRSCQAAAGVTRVADGTAPSTGYANSSVADVWKIKNVMQVFAIVLFATE